MLIEKMGMGKEPKFYTRKSMRIQVLFTGVAMFAMFFGAGNLVFPLKVGQYAQDGFILAMIGFLLTSVGIPFTGVVGVLLYEGNYKGFFGNGGKYLGLFLATLVIAIMGPFGGIPRCIALSFSTAETYLPLLNLPLFGLCYTLVLLAFCLIKIRIVDLIGYFLTPVLLISIGIIFIRGIMLGLTDDSVAIHLSLGSFSTFVYGLRQGYNTMDLFCGIFFSSIIYAKIKEGLELHRKKQYVKSNSVLYASFKASLVGASLLSIVYVGLGLLSLMYSNKLVATYGYDQLFVGISSLILGRYAGVIIGVTIILACLTTAIALTAVSAEFIQTRIFHRNISYFYSLVGSLTLSYLVSNLEFTGIVSMLAPVLSIIYPALYTLSLSNIFSKLFGFSYARIVFVVTLLFSAVLYFLLV